MRNLILTSFSLAVLAVFTLYASAVVARDQSCDLLIKVIEPNETDTDEDKPIKDASAEATRMGSRKSIAAFMLDGQPRFPKLTEGEYKLTVTKPGYSPTIQPISFLCTAPDTDAMIHIKLKPITSAGTVVNEKFIVRAGIIFGSKSPIADSNSTSSQIEVATTTQGTKVRRAEIVCKQFVLSRPNYPPIARRGRVTGTVSVQVTINEEGTVVDAIAVSGNLLLSPAASRAARESRFWPFILDGQPVKVTGIINYHFTLN